MVCLIYFKIEKINEYKNKDLDHISYQDVVEYNVAESYHNNFSGKDENSNHVIYAVNENNQWKIYRGKNSTSKM